MILDTNALSAFAEGEQAVREAITAHSGPYLPVIVLGEYRFGVMAAREREKRLAWLAGLEREWSMLEITAQTSVRYAEIRNDLKSKGTPIPSNDVWIAALAREHGLPILSNDPHFDLVLGIQRMGW